MRYTLSRILIKNVLTFAVLVLLTGCVSTIYVSQQIDDKEYKVESYSNHITKAAIFADTLILEVERQATPEQYAAPYEGRSKLCFTKNDFKNGVGLYLSGQHDNRFLCSDVSDDFFNSLPALPTTDALINGFLIPELQTIVYGTGNFNINTRCDCEILKEVASTTKSVFYFNKYLLYIELENGQWFKFSAGKRKLFVNSLQAEESSEAAFNNEKQTSNHKAKDVLFDSLAETGEKYLFVRLLHSNKYVYTYRFSDQTVFTEPMTSLFFQNDKTLEDVKVEEGNPLFYALYPFSIVFDIVTFPIQYGVYVYMIFKATSPDNAPN